MNSIFKVHTLQILLFAVTFSKLCYASDYWYHTCEFDKYNEDDKNLQLVEELQTSQSSTWKAFTATTTETWEPIRILISTKDLHDDKKYCKEENQKITDFMKNEMTCRDYNIFKDEERNKMKRIIRSAVTMHTIRLKVKPINHGFKVPILTGNICSSFSIPEAHKTAGVFNADMVLYVALLTSNSVYTQVIAAPCAKLKDGRPVVGGILYSIRGTDAVSSTVRVAAHHIAHALGFSYNVMSQNAGVKLTNKTGVRNKDRVLEVTGTNTVNFVKEHFECEQATGMELEDEMGELKVVSHSHWERRNARDDLMSPVISSGRYSALTLAFFTDLGYYQGQTDKAEPMQWGYGTQCDFLEKPCLENGETAYPTMFCANTRKDKRFCDENLELMRCSKVFTDETDVPSYFNYFSDPKKRTLSFTDNCPIIVHQGDADCKQDSHSAVPGIKGKDSLCFEKASESLIVHKKGYFEGMCVKVETTTDNQIQIIYESNHKVTCTDKKATLGNSYNGVVLECPTFDEIAFQKTLEEEANLLKENETADQLQEEIIQDTTQNSGKLQQEKAKTHAILKKTPPQKIIKPAVVESPKDKISTISEMDPKKVEQHTETPSPSKSPHIKDGTKNPEELKNEKSQTHEVFENKNPKTTIKPAVIESLQETNSTIFQKDIKKVEEKTKPPSQSESSTAKDTKPSDHETKATEVQTKANERETKMDVDSKKFSGESTASSPQSGNTETKKTERTEEKDTSTPIQEKDGNEKTASSSTMTTDGLQNVPEVNIKSKDANKSKSERATRTVKKLPNIEKVDYISDGSTMQFLSLSITIIFAFITSTVPFH